MENNEDTEQYHFTADGELAIQQYPGDSEQGSRSVDIIDKFVIDSGSQVFEAVDSNSYVTEPVDDGSHGEQFLTIPRGRTQITVCDNGNIVYTDDGLLDNANEEHLENPDDDTVYYQTEQDNDESNIEPMDVDSVDDNTQYIVDSNQIQSATFVAEAGNSYVDENVTQEESNEQEFQIRQTTDTVLSTDMKKYVALQQDTSRGIKRTSSSPTNKNLVTKVFIQGKPNATSGQPITIIGSLPGSRVSAAQAHRLGLLSSSKVQPGSSASSPARMIVKQIMPPASTSVLTVKSPTKILPAPSTNKTRINVIGGKGTSSPGNIMPVRTNIPVSQLKMLTAITSATTQVMPVTVTKNTASFSDSKSQQKFYVRPATTVLSPITGQLTRIGANPSFQPIQIKGKQSVQYVKLITPGGGTGTKPKFMKTVPARSVPIAPSPVTPKSISGATVVGNKIILPVSTSDGEKIIQLKSGSSVMPISVKGKTLSSVYPGVSFADDNQIVVLPEEEKSDIQEEIEELCDKENLETTHSESVLEANGIRPKKPCNCTKSQCLKLYCECFANGEFCFQCNCTNCFNNIEHEDERQLSIQSCLDRNPAAFRPKFQIRESEEEDRRNKGCNCRRSGCFKNYCECFEAKIPCSKVCKCQGCKNTEEEIEAMRKRDSDEEREEESGLKTPKFMSATLAEALCQCMLAQAEKAESNGDDVETTERLIVEEFGQCIVQIIGNRNKRDAR